MICDEVKPYLAGYVDDELTKGEADRLQSHLSRCSECRDDLFELKELRGLTAGMKSLDEVDAFWDRYWLGIYNRLERGLSWILMSVGALLLLGYGLFTMIRELFMDPSVPIVVRVGIGAALAGGLTLTSGVVRGRLFVWRHDPYKEVKR